MASGRLLQVGQQIAQLCRALIILRAGGLLHLLSQPLLHLLALAFEEVARRFDLLQILLSGHIADARRGAILQMRVEAMFVIALPRSQRPAAAQMVLAAHQRQCAAQRAGVGERPEIARAIILFETRQCETGDGIIQVELQEQKPFVVAKADIVTRVKFLDQLAFQQQGLRLAADRVKIEIMDGFDQRPELQVPSQSSRRLEILADPFAQVARLAGVNHRSEAVAHQINARLVRQPAELFANVLGHCHAADTLQVAGCRLQVDATRSCTGSATAGDRLGGVRPRKMPAGCLGFEVSPLS